MTDAPDENGPAFTWPVLVLGLAVLALGFVLGRRLLAQPPVAQPTPMPPAAPTVVAAPATASPAAAGTAERDMVGQSAPLFRLSSPSGEVIALEDLRGRPVLLNFFATWCGPCRVEMPHLEAAWRRHKDAGLVVLAVDVQETPEQVTAYLESLGLSFPAAMDLDGAVADRYQVRILPTSFFIDRDGRIARQKVGFFHDEADLAQDLAHILGAAAAPSPDPTAAWLARGGDLYARECASCHGAKGEGQPNWAVPLADGSLPAPPHDNTGHTWHHSDAELLRIIAEGGTWYLPTSKMPAFGDRLSADDQRAVLDHIKAWWGPKERGWQAEMTLQWAAMGARATPSPKP